MAGVPKVMQAMMDGLASTLKGGTKILSQHVDCALGEGTIGGPLTLIQESHIDTMIGSYPRFENGNITTQIVVRGRDSSKIESALIDVRLMIEALSK